MNEEISAYFKQYHKIDVDVVFNDKVIVITKLKLGHSKCRELFLGHASSNINTDFMCDFHTLQISEGRNLTPSDYSTDFINIWKSVLNKKEKRDIVLIYRNPIGAWLSGFYQDTIDSASNYIFTSTPYFTEYINSLGKYDNKLKENFIKDFKNVSSLASLFDTEVYLPIISDIISKNLDYYMDRNMLGTAHTKSWIPFIYKLINSNQIDTTKIKLLDLYDAPLEIQLKSYLDIPNLTKHGDYRRSVTQMQLLFNIVMRSKHSHVITMFLKEDYNLYIDLKENYKQYHLNYE